MSHNKPNNNHETVYTFDQRNDAVSDHTEAPSSITVRAEAAEILATLPNRISHVICWSAKERSDHPAVTDGATTLTYGELALLVENLAYTLKAFDIRAGDRVMIVSENSLHLVALLLATSEVDAWAVVVNPQLSEREINLIRAHSSARRVFYDGTTSTQAEAHAARNGATKEHIDQLGALWISPLNFAAMPEAVETHRSRQVAALMYTAGTTGNPKGVMLTHQNLLYAAAAYGLRCNTRPDDRVYGVLPMSHIIGISLILLGSLMAGATIEIVPRYDAATLAKSIADGSISILFGVPATYQRLLEHKAASGKAALSRGKLRRIAVAGAPLTTSLKQRIEAELGLSLSNGYGLTETSPSVTAVKSGRR